jgi:membrane protease subunit (stomatin/prohibitin family)
MGVDNIVFLENIEWFDESGDLLLQRIPENGSGEIKWGANLTVRESQAAVFFYKGKAVQAFPPGRHFLKTGNIPILTKIASLPWALSSPLRAEIIFLNLKTFTNLKWGTRDPVAFKDSELGLVRLRAFGVFNLKIIQPVLFVNSLVGTKGFFSTQEVEEYLNRVIVARFNDYMGETIDTILNLPQFYDQMSEALIERLTKDFSHFGLGITHLYINAITPPPEVQKAIDDRSRMGVFNDMQKLMQMKTAMAIEKAADKEGVAGDTMGIGLGMLAMPAMFQGLMASTQESGSRPAQEAQQQCQECRHQIPVHANFCPYCGHQNVIFSDCTSCGKHLPVNALYCQRCGKPVDEKPQPHACPKCGADMIPESKFCVQCGEKR